jgi:hypothetical protein
MSSWGWVALGFSTVYGVMILYIGWLAWRVRKANERLRRLM